LKLIDQVTPERAIIVDDSPRKLRFNEPKLCIHPTRFCPTNTGIEFLKDASLLHLIPILEAVRAGNYDLVKELQEQQTLRESTLTESRKSTGIVWELPNIPRYFPNVKLEPPKPIVRHLLYYSTLRGVRVPPYFSQLLDPTINAGTKIYKPKKKKKKLNVISK
jgi:hypothetical protein